MAIKRASQNPVLVLDAVVVQVERDAFTNRQTGETNDRGRKIALQTGAPNSDLLELRVPTGLDDVAFNEGEHVLINVEYGEWAFQDERGRDRAGSTMRFHSFVQPQQVDGWKTLLESAQKAEARQ